ncbi:MAG: hypothetical protein D6820_12655, partial [Lentisphaerae bacterium]
MNFSLQLHLTCLILGILGLGLFSDPAVASEGPWQNLNPGSGGRIIGIDLDETVPGRAFYSSDMEGIYETRDYGESWHFIGAGLTHGHGFVVKSDPQNPQRLYCGTLYSLEVSEDNGKHWQSVRVTEGFTIGHIAVDKNDPKFVYAAVGYRGRPPEARPHKKMKVYQSTHGDRVVFVSHDAGKTWRKIGFAAGEGWRGCYGVEVLPDGSVVLAAGDGVYRSSNHGLSWQKLPLPPGQKACWGATVSPDGKWCYAFFTPAQPGRQGGAKTRLYAASLTQSPCSWQDLGFPRNTAALYTWPAMDPRSTANEHRLLCSPRSKRDGLYLGHISHAGGKISVRWERALYWGQGFWGPPQATAPAFLTSWEQYSPRALAFTFTPSSWKRPGIWTTTGQMLYSVWTDRPNWQSTWSNRSSKLVKTWPVKHGLYPVRTWRTRGVQCTYTYMADAFKNYMIQSQGDNGALESWDNGYSWTSQTRPATWRGTNSMCNLIVRDLNPPVVLAHTSWGFGAGAEEGHLFAKKLIHFDP